MSKSHDKFLFRENYPVKFKSIRLLGAAALAGAEAE